MGSFRAGFVALVGLPNVGKSTLLNALVGQHLSIVTPKAQTTRRRFLGILSEDDFQAVFVDTPGILEPRYLLHESMQLEAEEGMRDADVVVLVADLGFEPSLVHAAGFLPPRGRPALLCLNKSDRVSGPDVETAIERFERRCVYEAVLATCAVSGEGIAALRAGLPPLLPENPPFYPTEDLAVEPLRYFAAELVRETCFDLLTQELPYSIGVAVEEFRESTDPVYVRAVVYVERESQKGIVVGKGGAMVRKIGTSSRQKLERLLERPVYLDLRVKVLHNWRRNPGRLKLLGYPVPIRRD